jgi:hypothetical protein
MKRRAIPLILMTAACGRGFEAKDLPGPGGTLEGRVLTDRGAPASSVPVFLVVDDLARARTLTDDSGSYLFEQPADGPVSVVANAGGGVGAYEDLRVYAGGINRAEDLVLTNLTESPRVLGFHGVGYEERLTETDPVVELSVSPGHLRPLILDPGGDVVVAHRGSELVRIDGSKLTEDQIASWPQAPQGFHTLFWSGGWCLAWLTTNNSTRGASLDVFDTESRSKVASFEDLVWDANQPSPIVATDSDSFVLFDGQRAILGGRDATITEVLLGDTPTWNTALYADRQHLVYAAGQYPDAEIVEVDFANRSATTLRSIQQVAFVVADAFDARTRALYLGLSSGATLAVTRFDLDSARLTTLYTGSQYYPDWYQIAYDAAVDHALLTHDSSGAFSFADLDLGTGTTRPLPIVDPMHGMVESACFERNAPNANILCLLGYGASAGQLTLIGQAPLTSTSAGAQHDAVTFYADVSDQRVTRELDFPLKYLGYQRGVLAQRRDLSLEVLEQEDPRTGFLQLYAAKAGADRSEFRRLTFLPEDHEFLQTSADGRWVFYRALDPVLGTYQVFRVAVSSDAG